MVLLLFHITQLVDRQFTRFFVFHLRPYRLETMQKVSRGGAPLIEHLSWRAQGGEALPFDLTPSRVEARATPPLRTEREKEPQVQGVR